MIYFDNAATTYPKPKEVYDFMDNFYRNYGGSYARGSYNLENPLVNIVLDTRAKIKEILNRVEISENERAENISIDKFIELIDIFEGR